MITIPWAGSPLPGLAQTCPLPQHIPFQSSFRAAVGEQTESHSHGSLLHHSDHLCQQLLGQPGKWRLNQPAIKLRNQLSALPDPLHPLLGPPLLKASGLQWVLLDLHQLFSWFETEETK